jgi:hypothetical protein
MQETMYTPVNVFNSLVEKTEVFFIVIDEQQGGGFHNGGGFLVKPYYYAANTAPFIKAVSTMTMNFAFL